MLEIKTSSFITFHPGEWPMTTGEQSTTPACSGKPGVRIGTITALLSEVFSQKPQQKCGCPEGWPATLPFRYWRDGDSPKTAVCTEQKSWESQPDTGQRGRARTRQCGGKCTREKKSCISMLKLVRRKDPSLPFLLRNEGLWTLMVVMILRQDQKINAQNNRLQW